LRVCFLQGWVFLFLTALSISLRAPRVSVLHVGLLTFRTYPQSRKTITRISSAGVTAGQDCIGAEGTR
jgi:hypothetical protein